MATSAFERPAPGGPATTIVPVGSNGSGAMPSESRPSTGRPSTAGGSSACRYCVGRTRTAGAGRTPASTMDRPSFSVAAACADTDGVPPMTATCSSRPSSSARPFGESAVMTSRGALNAR